MPKDILPAAIRTGWWRAGTGIFIVAATIYAHFGGALPRSAKEE
jgi:hypothetical protein